MKSKPFQFKQFLVHQDKTAMKVGTDGVLLGAWAELKNEVTSVLDIGSGTGLIALMIAQRSNAKTIDAIELDENAYVQSVENFERSQWADRLFCYHTSLQNFAEEIDEKYDFIVSNPPFYTSTYKELPVNRAMARHTETLSYNDLLKNTSLLLHKKGSCAFIVPFVEEENFVKTAQQYQLYPYRITRVKGSVKSAIKRSMLQFSFQKKECKVNTLTIEKERHSYTSEYKNLAKDFYLKMNL